MASVAKALGINLNTTLGAAFIGLVVSAMLYGVSVMQSIGYFENSSRDPRYMKIIVSVLLFLDTLHMLLMSHVMYTYLITDFGNILEIAASIWSIDTMVLLSTIMCCIVDLCYLHRVWIISKKNVYLVLPSVVSVFVVTGVGVGIGIKCYQYESILQVEEISWMMYFSLCGAMANNVIITASLCYYLFKSRTGFSASERKITELMKYIVSTGFLTVICSICVLVTFATMPENYIFLAFYESYSKVFFNALLAMLNARGRLGTSSNASDFSSGEVQELSARRLPKLVYISAERRSGSKVIGQNEYGYGLTELHHSGKNDVLAIDNGTNTDYYLPREIKNVGHGGDHDHTLAKSHNDHLYR